MAKHKGRHKGDHHNYGSTAGHGPHGGPHHDQGPIARYKTPTGAHHKKDRIVHPQHNFHNDDKGLPHDMFAHDGAQYGPGHGNETMNYGGGDHMNGGGPVGGETPTHMVDNQCDEEDMY